MSGPYTDPAVATDIRAGLPARRAAWILARGDVEERQGRATRPEDNGLGHGEATSVPLFDRGARGVLRAKAGRGATQLAKFCSMKISQEVRDYAQSGMADKSTEFRRLGSELYKVAEDQAAPAEP